MTTEKNSTHSPTYCASKTGIPNLWIVNLIEIAKVLIEKKKEEEEETRRKDAMYIYHCYRKVQKISIIPMEKNNTITIPINLIPRFRVTRSRMKI